MRLTIGELGLSSTSRNRKTEFILRYKHPEVRIEYNQKRKLLLEWAKKFTLKDYIDAHALAAREFRLPGDIKNDLITRGFNYLDWNELPASTVTTNMLKKLTKEELLRKKVIILGTFSSLALKVFELYTIDELLHTASENTWRHRKEFGVSLEKTRRKLRELGFKYEDGIFLQAGTRRELIERLMHHHPLKHKVAALVADVAERRGWVKPFINSDG